MQVTKLTGDVNEYKEQVSSLKHENSELKIAKLSVELELEEVKNEYETSKVQIKALNQQINKLRADSPQQYHQQVATQLFSDDDDNNSVFSGSPVNPRGSFQNLSNFNNLSTDYLDAADVKERLSHWKGWNIDMRGWRSVGMGPLLEL
ncbi:hypothetical protein FOA43_000745 [Brettanomyces nanus]|uniref:Uncharacterized protein n=1 Tax=Eeniella nana TaxID=13502 RepID=A0A875RZH8_EENNA|nr:uncharacterized protein FOA43_000745 [Brettanomyces nanus]QPG73435.1 hypothetical protein FOA43_000745 [Brettanomyces nanus]